MTISSLVIFVAGGICFQLCINLPSICCRFKPIRWYCRVRQLLKAEEMFGHMIVAHSDLEEKYQRAIQENRRLHHEHRENDQVATLATNINAANFDSEHVHGVAKLAQRMAEQRREEKKLRAQQPSRLPPLHESGLDDSCPEYWLGPPAN